MFWFQYYTSTIIFQNTTKLFDGQTENLELHYMYIKHMLFKLDHTIMGMGVGSAAALLQEQNWKHIALYDTDGFY